MIPVLWCGTIAPRPVPARIVVGMARALLSGMAHGRVRLMGMKCWMNVLPAAGPHHVGMWCCQRGYGGRKRWLKHARAWRVSLCRIAPSCLRAWRTGAGVTGPAWPGHAATA
ncbi:hypothetical protein LU298_13525 [Komagataeibacter intermedius]|uniref:hypothetical protein n=1 Tax=Komagataeibacter intermedius TaxID=66229 RepID=UPI0011469622|nr:hypothetical protein [Komagataeibacter intermedius]MCF3637510.1 hypothetical protein [Komagataeibacter intermedius]